MTWTKEARTTQTILGHLDLLHQLVIFKLNLKIIKIIIFIYMDLYPRWSPHIWFGSYSLELNFKTIIIIIFIYILIRVTSCWPSWSVTWVVSRSTLESGFKIIIITTFIIWFYELIYVYHAKSYKKIIKWDWNV
jgi:hypothetical protein